MEQLIFASISHTHYLSRVGMLKVPAYKNHQYVLRVFLYLTVMLECFFPVLKDSIINMYLVYTYWKVATG